MVENARKKLEQDDDTESDDEQQPSWTDKLLSRDGWQQISTRYVMEWRMVYCFFPKFGVRCSPLEILPIEPVTTLS